MAATAGAAHTQRWRCSFDGVDGEFLFAHADSDTRLSLVDVLTMPPQLVLADAKAVAAAAISQWPGLTLVAVPHGKRSCFLLARDGGNTALQEVSAELAAVVCYSWVTNRRPLATLRSLSFAAVQLGHTVPDSIHQWAVRAVEDADSFVDVCARRLDVAVILTDVDERQEYLSVVYG